MLEWVKGQDSGRSFEHRIRLAGLEKERQQKVLVSQSCLIPCDPMNCTPLGSSVHSWDSPSKNSGVGSHSILQGIFLTQGSNTGLLQCRQILYHLTHQGRLEGGNRC